jgi:hypothetical protein
MYSPAHKHTCRCIHHSQKHMQVHIHIFTTLTHKTICIQGYTVTYQIHKFMYIHIFKYQLRKGQSYIHSEHLGTQRYTSAHIHGHIYINKLIYSY